MPPLIPREDSQGWKQARAKPTVPWLWHNHPQRKPFPGNNALLQIALDSPKRQGKNRRKDLSFIPI